MPYVIKNVDSMTEQEAKEKLKVAWQRLNSHDVMLISVLKFLSKQFEWLQCSSEAFTPGELQRKGYDVEQIPSETK